MSDFSTARPGHGLFRGILLVSAVLLGCLAAWLLAPEIFRPGLSGFPADAQAVAAAAAERDDAGLAASLGVVRGDLWAEDALTYLDAIRNSDGGDGRASEAVEQAREVADRALARSPHDARIWLLLASIDTRFDWLNRNRAANLRMSYYTGGNEIDLVPLRLRLAVRSDAISEADFQQLVRHDVTTVVRRRPDLKPAILAAYRDAPLAGQQFLEQTLAEIDPDLRARLPAK